MRRAIIKQGHNTFTVSLPKKWCDSHGLTSGEEVDVSERGSCLLISKESYSGSGTISVNITGLSGSTIILLLDSLYVYGYDTINITTKDTKVPYHMQGREQSVSATIKFAVDRMLGAEVTSSTPAGCTVQVLTDDAKEKFDLVLRRIFRLLPEMFDTYIEGTQSDVDVFRETVNFKHNQIKKFVNYGLRLLNKFGHEDASKTTFYFAIIDYLGKIDEIMKNMVEYAIKNNKQRIGKKCLAYMKEVKNAFDSYHAFFYSYDLKKVTEFHKNRDLFKLRNSDAFRTMNQEEVYILASFTQIYDILIDLSELRMSIGY